ncbi:hypothetical protein M3J09_003452 [Ascochyta lentis]
MRNYVEMPSQPLHRSGWLFKAHDVKMRWRLVRNEDVNGVELPF